MRVLAWFGTLAVFSTGCAWLISFDGLSDGTSSSSPILPDGGPEDAPDAPEPGVTTVRSSQQTLRGIAVGGDYLYWVEGTPPAVPGGTGGWGVYRAPRSDAAGTVKPIYVGADIYDVATNATHVFWTDGGNVQRWNPSSDVIEPMYFPAGASPRFLSVDGLGRVFVVIGDSAIATGPCATTATCLDTGPVAGMPGIVAFSSLMGVSGIALGAGRVFWGQSAPAGVTSGDPVSRNTQPVDFERPAPKPVSGVAMDGVEVFWMAGDHSILAAPAVGLSGTGPRLVCDDAENLGIDGGFGQYADLAVDQEWVYFSEPSVGLIRRCKKS
jgi:hypothetical protein